MSVHIQKCKEFPKTGKIYLPKKYRTLFETDLESRVDIYYEKNRIYIEKEEPSSIYNKRYVSQEGAVKIPKEIMDTANITPEREYCLYVDEDNNRFVITLMQDEDES